MQDQAAYVHRCGSIAFTPLQKKEQPAFTITLHPFTRHDILATQPPEPHQNNV